MIKKNKVSYVDINIDAYNDTAECTISDPFNSGGALKTRV